MKYYLIADKMGQFKGYTTNKEIMKIFLKQRDLKKYIIQEVKEKDLNSKFIENLQQSWEEIFIDQGVALCYDEEDYFINALTGFFDDVRLRAGYLQRFVSYLKLNKEEEKKINEAIQLIVLYVNYADCNDEINENECVDQDRYLKMDVMLKYIINILN
jgi:hypothetical protein